MDRAGVAVRVAPRAFAAYLAEPLAQRPPGSAGKQGDCLLSFTVAHGKTLLRHSFVTHPFHLTRPWYLDAALPGMAVVYLQSPAGGLIQGDRATMRFTLEPGAQVHLTSQAAEKIHTMNANCAVQQTSFVLGVGAYAEYCPEPVILFPGARFAQELTVELGTGASMFLAEIFLSRAAANGSSFDALATSVKVHDSTGALLLRERGLALSAQQDLRGPGMLGSYPVWGQAWLVGPRVSPAWSQALAALLAAEQTVICGVTVLPWERGIGVKAMGAEVRAVRRVLYTAWNWLRLRHVGAPAPMLPK